MEEVGGVEGPTQEECCREAKVKVPHGNGDKDRGLMEETKDGEEQMDGVDKDGMEGEEEYGRDQGDKEIQGLDEGSKEEEHGQGKDLGEVKDQEQRE
jgi:hypothetical protein